MLKQKVVCAQVFVEAIVAAAVAAVDAADSVADVRVIEP